jgi:hypothetical protein
MVKNEQTFANRFNTPGYTWGGEKEVPMAISN